MIVPKISVSCMVSRPTGAHRNPVSDERDFLETSRDMSRFVALFESCLCVLKRLGEIAQIIEVIKITPVESSNFNDNDGNPKVVWEIDAILGGNEYKLNLLPKLVLELDNDDHRERELEKFRKDLYCGIRKLVEQRVENSGRLHERWKSLIPPQIPADD